MTRTTNGHVKQTKIRTSLKLLTAIALAGMAAGCGSEGNSGGLGGSSGGAGGGQTPSAVEAAFKKGAAVDGGIVAANNQMGLAIFNQLRGAAPRQNMTISPTSISIALAMAYNGAGGTTAPAMAAAMQVGEMTPQQVNAGNAALQASLISPDKGVTFTIANSLWTHGTSQINPAFATANQTYYAAHLGDLAGAPNNINAWCSSATNGLITDIAPSMDYTSVVAVLVNALYFKGAWQSPFDPTVTSAQPFTTAAGTQQSVQMMSQTSFFRYYAGPDFQLVQLPYGTGRETMIVILPKTGVDLSTVIPEITSANLNTWLTAATPNVVSLALPKFTTSYSTLLNDTLKALGMGVAFDMNLADFSSLSSTIKPLYIGFVQHKTKVEVDEAGTIAAAATSIGVTSTAAPVIQQTVNVNHPFFYAIQDSKTSELLFVGQITSPAQ